MAADKISTVSLQTTIDEIVASLLSKNGNARISPVNFARELFSRGAEEILSSRSVSSLRDTALDGYEFFSSFLNKESEVLVRTKIGTGTTVVLVATKDRPFIVSTVAECARSCGIEISLLLHPILKLDERSYSFCYLELDSKDSSEIERLKESLSQSLLDLVHIADDFTSLMEKCGSVARLTEMSPFISRFSHSENQETSSFLRWLADECFIFEGYACFKGKGLKFDPDSALGLFRSSSEGRKLLVDQASQDAKRLVEDNEPIWIDKLQVVSPIHRKVRLSNIVVHEVDNGRETVSVHCFVGLLTSRGITQESSSVPLVRAKLRKLLAIEGVSQNSHDYKYIVDIADRMPKDTTLRLPVQALHHLVKTSLSFYNTDEIRVAVSPDKAGRSVSVVVVMMKDRYNEELRFKLQSAVEDAFGVPRNSSEFHLDLLTYPFARFYFSLPVGEVLVANVDIERLEGDLQALSRTWKDELKEALADLKTSDPAVIELCRALPQNYQATTSTEEAIGDVKEILSLTKEKSLRVSIRRGLKSPSLSLSVYSLSKPIALNKALPILENSGFEVIEESTYQIEGRRGRPDVIIYRFLVMPRHTVKDGERVLAGDISSALAMIFREEAEDDSLNSLMLGAGLSVRQVALVRTYSQFLWQTGRFTGRTTIFDALIRHPDIVSKLVSAFEVKFNPSLSLSLEERAARSSSVLEEVHELLTLVHDFTFDRILRGCASLISNTVRTNYFLNLPAIVVKFASEKIDILPQPRPFREIFTLSPTMKGVHLRSGAVARGGIRWSDRTTDFRSEVLGLVKTQRIKNSFIVPTGAKGGFVIRNLPHDERPNSETVEKIYGEYIRALLSVADNREGDSVVHPMGVIAHDGQDPYFVVAADKGTATFSDFANRIAEDEHNLWLRDAFASGGSNGYDHKALGITSRGVWECVKCHFHELGIDYENEAISVVGIGDMSGDVFGNGLLLCKNFKLIAAFNHLHIFIDPNPDIAKSFKERSRLFSLKRSQWTDYDTKLISKGGGVFLRAAKEIPISPEAREALGVQGDVPKVVSGELLVSLILKAPVDLLWNGGIGTYVKSESESHGDVNDSTNDRVRVNANEVRARVIGEGGNLGLTQRARVDFASKGGAVNIDAIDNSGGVGLSDREVNIKILLEAPLRRGEITKAERNSLLKAMSGEVVDSVLAHNRNHALSLAIAEYRSLRNVEYFQSMLSFLSKNGYINRSLEELPDDEELRERIQQQLGLTRPELAICLSASKMWTKDIILQSKLRNDEMLKDFLLSYFPKVLGERFKGDILAHPLAEHIIATQVTNYLVDGLGITFLFRISQGHGVHPSQVMKAALAVDFLFEAEKVRKSLDKLDTAKDNGRFLRFRRELGQMVRDATVLTLSRHDSAASIQDILTTYTDGFELLLSDPENILSGSDLIQFKDRYSQLQLESLDSRTAKILSLFPIIVPVLEMIGISQKSGKSLKSVCTVFNGVITSLGLEAVIGVARKVHPTNRWEKELLTSGYDILRSGVRNIVNHLLDRGVESSAAVKESLISHESYGAFAQRVEEAKYSPPSAALLTIIARQLSRFRS